MPPKSCVRPIRIHVPHERDGVHTVRGVGFRFACSCGERGKRRFTYAAARGDLLLHREDHERLAKLEAASPIRGTEAS